MDFSNYPPKKEPPPLPSGIGRCEACGVEGLISYFYDCSSWLDQECRDKGLTRIR